MVVSRDVGDGLDPRCGLVVGGQIKTLSPMEKKASGARGHTGRREFGGANQGRSLRKGQRSMSRGVRIGQRRRPGGKWAEARDWRREPEGGGGLGLAEGAWLNVRHRRRGWV